MNTSVQALQLVYIKMGGALTDTYSTIASGEMVGNYTAIPDVVEAIAQISKANNLINSVSTEDNDKVLKVVNGAAEFAELDGGGGGNNDFVVNYLTETDATTGEPNIVCDKTAAEIYEAWEAGKNVKALFPELVPFQIPIVMASQEDDYTRVEFGTVTWEATAFFIGVFHVEDSNGVNIVPLQKVLVDTVLLNNELGNLEERFAGNSIVYRQIDANGDIEVEDEDAILPLLKGISKHKGVRCVFDPNNVGEPYLLLNIQSVNTVYNSSDQINTHTVIFSNVLPTAAGVKCVFITQSATTNSTTTELISHTETYEENILSVQAP